MAKKSADTLNEVLAQVGEAYKGGVSKPIQSAAERLSVSNQSAAGSDVAEQVVEAGSIGDGFIEVRLDLLDDSPSQNRLQYDPEKIDELAVSLENSKQITPIRIRAKADGRYEIISGHRRVRAARIKGWTSLVAQVVTVTDVVAALELMIANEQEEIGDYERAVGYKTLLDFGLTQASIADKIGIHRSLISRRIKMLSLPASVLAAMNAFPRALNFAIAGIVIEILEANPELESAAAEGVKRVGIGEWQPQVLISDLRRRQHGSTEQTQVVPYPVVGKDGKKFATVKARPDGQISIRFDRGVNSQALASRISQLLQSEMEANPSLYATASS